MTKLEIKCPYSIDIKGNDTLRAIVCGNSSLGGIAVTAVLVREKVIHEYKGSKLSIGGLRSGEKKFEETTINYKEDDMLYLFTDGYADQFGGEQSKKFTYKRLKELLLSIHRLRTNEQKVKIEDTIKSWQGENEQIDDMLVIGIKF